MHDLERDGFVIAGEAQAISGMWRAVVNDATMIPEKVND
jgi:hypothetical protein